jgi:hypothetical protein
MTWQGGVALCRDSWYYNPLAPPAHQGTIRPVITRTRALGALPQGRSSRMRSRASSHMRVGDSAGDGALGGHEGDALEHGEAA